MDDCDVLIVIDACDAGGLPGSLLVREWPAVMETGRSASTHGLGLDETLRLAERLGKLSPRVLLFGVQACRCEPSDDLSPEVTGALPVILSRLRELILQERLRISTNPR